MKKISKREFSRSIYSYLKVGEYVVTKNGEPEFVVTIKKVDGVLEEDVVTIKSKEDVLKKVPSAVNSYGCGCKRVERKIACPVHRRY